MSYDQTIDNICDAIESIGDGISGIEASYSEPPSALNTADLPCLFPLIGPATDYQYATQMGSKLVKIPRIFRIVVPVMPKGIGTPEEIETIGRPLIAKVTFAFIKKQTLPGVDTVLRTQVLNDTGLILLDVFDGKYIGFEVEFLVEVLERYVYQDT